MSAVKFYSRLDFERKFLLFKAPVSGPAVFKSIALTKGLGYIEKYIIEGEQHVETYYVGDDFGGRQGR